MNRFQKWLSLATKGTVVRRASFYAVVVGIILIAINHGPNLVCGKFGYTCVFQMMLTMCVPYTVSTLSSVQALLEQEKEKESLAASVDVSQS